MNRDAPQLTLYSIGHSNRPLETFLDLLHAHAVRCLVDVRAFPSSRRWPHFNRESLAASLQAHGIAYDWMPALGGRRGQPRTDSPHTAWTVKAFRAYADYMDTDAFAGGFDQLLTAARVGTIAFMCAEALYWQCHRRLIADRLTVLGHRVRHIQTPTRAPEHQLPRFARVVGAGVVYDGGTQLPLRGTGDDER